MASSFFFQGRLWSTPATMSQIDDTAMAPTSLTVGNVLALIGNCTGGQSNVPLIFGNPQDAQAMLLSGDLMTAAMKAFNPSDAEDVEAPSSVVCIRVGQTTPATLTLLDSTGANALVLTSKQYGTPANQVKVMVANGSLSGLQITTQMGKNYVVGDNLGRAALSVHYTGAGVGTISVSPTTVSVMVNGTVELAIPLATYPVVDQVVDVINTVAGFSATVGASASGTPSLNGLDSVLGANCSVGTYTVTANLQACLEWLNSPASVFVTATRPANAGLPPALLGWNYLAGGTASPVMMSDWTNALTVLQGVDCQHFACLSPLPAVWAAADAHAQFMSTVGRKERRAYSGPGTGTSVAALEALPILLNSDRSAICGPGYYDYDVNGNLTLYPSYMTAAVVAAAFAGADPGTPMTNRAFTFRGLELYVNDPTDTDPLIQAGVLIFESGANGYTCVRSVSTWLQNNNYNRVEISCGIALDFAARNVRNAVNALKGQRGDPRLLARAITVAEGALAVLAQPQPQGPGVLVGDANSPAYQNITASIVGDVVSISFQASPVIPANFFPITIYAVPYSGTASA